MAQAISLDLVVVGILRDVFVDTNVALGTRHPTFATYWSNRITPLSNDVRVYSD